MATNERNRPSDDASEDRLRFALLAQVVGLPVEDREALLEASDPALAADVREMLADDETGDGFLSRPPLGQPTAEPELPSAIGPYRLVKSLGEGGMGQVFLAQQDEPVRRQVALKILRTTVAGREARARFEAERHAMGQLDHPNIGTILDAGTTEDGMPYFAMELIDGPPITVYCDDQALSIEDRLRLFVGVCRGAEHAHRKLLLHRDIKPSNVLVTEVDDRPVPKVIDFGIAKGLDDSQNDGTFATGDRLIGTPGYMSPEALGLGGDVDTRTDVFSLGVLLFELLTGGQPWGVDPPTPVALMKRRLEADAMRPSTHVSTLDLETRTAVARRRREDRATLVKRLRGDLDWIALKAVAADPAARYGSAAALAADVERYLADEPIVARPPSLRYQLTKYARRHRIGVVAGALVLTSLVTGVIGTTLGLLRANRAEAEAKDLAAAALHARDESEETVELMISLFDATDPMLPQTREGEPAARTAREILERGVERVAEDLADRPLIRARLQGALGGVYYDIGLYDEAGPLLEEALDTRLRILGKDHIDVAESQQRLASLLNTRAEYVRAEQLRRASLATRTRLLGAQHLDVAEAQHRLANTLRASGEYEEPEALYRESLATRQLLHGGDHLEVADSFNNLAEVLKLQGEHEKAEALHRESLAMRRRLFGDQSLHVVVALSNLGGSLYGRGDHAAAEPLYRESLAIHRHHLGNDHHRVATNLNNLATVLRAQGDYDAAVPLFRESSDIYRRLLGPKHRALATSLTNLSRALVEGGTPTDCEILTREAVAICEQAFPADHWRTYDAKGNLGACLGAHERYAEAEPLLLAAYEAVGEARGTRSRSVQYFLTRLVALYDGWNRPDAASRYRTLLNDDAR